MTKSSWKYTWPWQSAWLLILLVLIQRINHLHFELLFDVMEVHEVSLLWYVLLRLRNVVIIRYLGVLLMEIFFLFFGCLLVLFFDISLDYLMLLDLLIWFIGSLLLFLYIVLNSLWLTLLRCLLFDELQVVHLVLLQSQFHFVHLACIFRWKLLFTKLWITAFIAQAIKFILFLHCFTTFHSNNLMKVVILVLRLLRFWWIR